MSVIYRCDSCGAENDAVIKSSDFPVGTSGRNVRITVTVTEGHLCDRCKWLALKHQFEPLRVAP